MSEMQIELIRTQFRLICLQAREQREGLEQFLSSVVEKFGSIDPTVQDLMIEVVDEAAQEGMRVREVYDTALTKMKQIKENAGEQ